MATSNFARSFFSQLRYLIFLIGAVLLILYLVFWLPFRADLRAVENPDSFRAPLGEPLEIEIGRHLGWIVSKKQSHFLEFEERKPAGTKRVCAFGDSFTAGAEVGREHDFPTILGRMLAERGTPNIEVVNFGAGWYGFHQAYIAWEYLAPRYECDIILLGPACFQPNRDTRFNHTKLSCPTCIHSRYVLEGGDLKLLAAYGDTREERFENYVRFIPRWRYLRYEREPAPLLRALLPEGRTLSNPFYYYAGDEESEAYATYRILLERMGNSGMPVVLIHWNEEIVELARPLAREGFAVGAFDLPWGFPYRAPQGHASAWGNRLVAEHFYAELNREAPRSFPFLVTYDVREESDAVRDTAVPLTSYSEIEVELAGHTVARLLGPEKNGEPLDVWSAGANSLLAIRPAGSSLIDAFFVPLDAPIEAGARLSVGTKRGSEQIELGVVEFVHPGLNVGVVTSDAFTTSRSSNGLELRPGILEDERPENVRVFLDGRPLLGRVPEKRKLEPLEAEFLQIRVPEGVYIPLEELPQSATVYLRLTHPQTGVERIPLAAFERSSRKFPLIHGRVSLSESDR